VPDVVAASLFASHLGRAFSALKEDYFRAIQELAEIGAAEISHTEEPEAVRAILSVIAIAKGLRAHGRFLVDYSEGELLDIESRR